MSERLAFGFGTSAQRVGPASRKAAEPAPMAGVAPLPVETAPRETPRESRDWAFLGLMAFTALLFFRPQDQLPFLRSVPLADLAAIIGLVAMVAGRLRRGLTISRVTPELLGVLAFGLAILATAPFSIWIGGSVGTFTDMYAKVILIFLLMANTLTTPKRIERFMWLIVVASTYIGFRAVLDYSRGINLIEYGRVQGALGGIFRNPNDLALNMVAVLPVTVLLATRTASTPRRLLTLAAGGVMIAAIVASHSRSGTVGLAGMMLVAAVLLVRRRPGLVFAGALALVLALPLAPDAYWERISSITDESRDDTGSREARSVLLHESWDAFVANPLTGVGAGQFENYNPEGRLEAWRESHNVLLQVAADLGVVGLLAFGFLLARATVAGRYTRFLVRRATGGANRRSGVTPTVVTPQEAAQFDAHAVALSASLAGWFICALFASVAYNWTFYYMLALAAAPHAVLLERLAAARPAPARAGALLTGQEARA